MIGQADAALVAAGESAAARRGPRAISPGARWEWRPVSLALWMWDFTIDDALISVRYARHLATGLGYRFNQDGPATDGVTPLPWPFVLAPFARAPALVVLARAKALGLATWLAAAGAWGIAVGRAQARVEAKLAALVLLACVSRSAAHAGQRDGDRRGHGAGDWGGRSR